MAACCLLLTLRVSAGNAAASFRSSASLQSSSAASAARPGLVATPGSACTACTNVSGCAEVSPTGCGDSAPYCVRHGTQCVCKSTDIGTSGHAYYGAGPSAPARFAALEYDTVWTQMPETGSNCYASMMMYWSGAGGYMGSQFHSNGEQWVLFSIWDRNSTVKNSHPAASNCLRFGGEGEGSHCPVTMKLRVGSRYRFHVAQTSKNSSGVVWTATVTDLRTKKLTTIGSLYWDEAAAGVPLGTISSAPIAFQEYYTGGNFSSAVGFVGPYGIDDAGAKHEMATAACISDGKLCPPLVAAACLCAAGSLNRRTRNLIELVACMDARLSVWLLQIITTASHASLDWSLIRKMGAVESRTCCCTRGQMSRTHQQARQFGNKTIG